jgi:hypothetical protein
LALGTVVAAPVLALVAAPVLALVAAPVLVSVLASVSASASASASALVLVVAGPDRSGGVQALVPVEPDVTVAVQAPYVQIPSLPSGQG